MVLTKIESGTICIYSFNLSFFFLVRAARQAGVGVLRYLIEILFSGSGGIQLENPGQELLRHPAGPKFRFRGFSAAGNPGFPGSVCFPGNSQGFFARK